MPPLQDADLATGEQHRQPVKLVGRPDLAAPQLRPVKFHERHGRVLAGPVQVGAGHDPVVIGDDLDLRPARGGVDEPRAAPPRRGAPGELQPVHRTVVAAHVPRPVHTASVPSAARLTYAGRVPSSSPFSAVRLRATAALTLGTASGPTSRSSADEGSSSTWLVSRVPPATGSSRDPAAGWEGPVRACGPRRWAA